jgi:predicted RNA-binding protein YlxR (DUF448 family)
VRLVARDGRVAIDATGAAPGRGTYLCGAACAAPALRRGALARRLRRAVRVPEDFETRLREVTAWREAGEEVRVNGEANGVGHRA